MNRTSRLLSFLVVTVLLSGMTGVSSRPAQAAANRPPHGKPMLAVNVLEDAADTIQDVQSCFLDPDGDSLSYTVTGNTNPGLFSAVTLASGSLTLDYAPDAYGSAVITLRATDPGGLWGETILNVTVAPVDDPSVLDAGPGQTASEGQSVAFSGSFIDPDNLPVMMAWDFGDGATASGSLAAAHTYADEGVYTVTLTVTDDQGAVTTDMLIVTVENVAPDLPQPPDQISYAYHVNTVAGSFSDPGVLDAHTMTIQWAPGLVETLSLPAGETAFSFRHAYNALGVYPVTLTVSDEDGGVTSRTFTIAVPVFHYYYPIMTGIYYTGPFPRR